MSKLRSWERADHRFAIASIGLLSFLLLAGVAAWLLDEKPGIAAASAHTVQTNPLQ